MDSTKNFSTVEIRETGQDVIRDRSSSCVIAKLCHMRTRLLSKLEYYVMPMAKSKQTRREHYIFGRSFRDEVIIQKWTSRQIRQLEDRNPQRVTVSFYVGPLCRVISYKLTYFLKKHTVYFFHWKLIWSCLAITDTSNSFLKCIDKV